MTQHPPLTIVGGGLAGCEAAWQAARAGLRVILIEMRPLRTTEAHLGDGLAELVCSNSLRSDDPLYNAVGLLHEEMRRAGSLILAMAEAHRVPAGGALAVDRQGFSDAITRALAEHPLIEIRRGEVDRLPAVEDGPAIIASGPLTSAALAAAIAEATGETSLAFFDAIAPIVHKDSIDFDRAWFQSRYDKGDGRDYINCPLTRDQYDAFVDALLAGEKTMFKEWEGTPYFDGCLPIEVMAERGRETLAFGPMKPVGLTDPRNPGLRPHAVVQLRQDNALGTLYNMVGFQTKLKHGEQARIFRMIPGLENAEFARLGGIHRNTFLNSPRLLDPTLRLKARPHLRFAGQITGCEGYVESAAIGLLAGRFASAEILDAASFAPPPPTTALGGLLGHITGGANAETFQPMNVNFGLLPPLEARPVRPGAKPRVPKGRERKLESARRALVDLGDWLRQPSPWSAEDSPRAALPIPEPTPLGPASGSSE
ncbi:tRNA (uracil-5-)-methyltransferase Gid [Rhodospirillum rubrum F11]|uniref:Methylenetetrahydrofolate--tRNA-(uracil-5-)-methyltransferase TrmFO n=3 Tax=Rhodospirillum rubrum TaxID=1085 RepID=TRMFO_RHORT|nr:methylenetetrahydrofolate--tRNA-(uracil(54)-C(5))-methyltransferase (FADH(2)-oxidizing) TrmFO [Rhodospirillum rubrum]Q2RTI8.1 RecName: Full=Methylenetetrahydrofolate--tRNA-(uracil-5-)-methyltransferase TrmFO; AltName: Full=Folate-dependent tRNA (uracil-5-)-methyltransferase; AltName: Full=Folate-dependent tRNA(M-5-U54)-methyltransferase [Rhodospirillum rubrum ATCC 11170]ABC22557.1 Gid protein [Rhodospirillum rubrum ATCC 11170]AEO48275.1 tRNA (uracil-5-)-methyltransferase Gid [Rhodospirillum r